MVKVALDNQGTPDSENQPATEQKSARAGSAAKPRSRWLLKLTLVSLLLISAAPSALTLSGQTSALLRNLHPKLAAAVHFRSVTLHWWAPVRLEELTLRDLSLPENELTASEQQFLCSVKELTTAEPLWRIVLNAGRGTGIVLKSPLIRLTADSGGNNVNRTLSEIFGESPETSSERFPIRLTIDNGEIRLFSGSQQMASEATLTSPEASPAIPLAEQSPLKAKSSRVAQEAQPTAVMSGIQGSISTMDTDRWLPAVKLTAAIRNLPVEGVTATGRRSQPPRSARLAAELDEVISDFPNVPLDELAGTDESGDASAARIQVHLNPRADEKGRQTIQIGARGLDLRLIQPLLSLAGYETACEGLVTGGLDARLAGATLLEGLVGRVRIQGEKVRFRQQHWARNEWLPLGTLEADGAVAAAEDGLLIRDLRVASDLLNLSGNGELRHSTSSASGSSQNVVVRGHLDLARLSAALRETLTLHQDVTIQRGKLTFAAKASEDAADSTAWLQPNEPKASVTRVADANARLITPVSMSKGKHSRWQAAVRLEDFAAERNGVALRVDSELGIDAVGDFPENRPRLQQARLSAAFGNIDCAPDGTGWKIAGVVQPAALWDQLRQFADVPQPGIRGDVQLQAGLRLLDSAIQLTDVQLQSADVTVTTAALSILPENSIISMLDGTVHLEGTGAAVRTLISPWAEMSWLAEASRVTGDLTASPSREVQLSVRIRPESVANVAGSTVRSVSLAGHPISRHMSSARPAAGISSAFQVDEGEVDLVMLARDAGRQFDIQRGKISLPGIASLITGTVQTSESDLMVDLIADTSYDLELLSRRLLSPDSGIRLSGQGRDKFALQGSPSALTGTATAPDLNASAAAFKGSGTIRWDSAEFSGLQAGAGALQATLENNLLRGAPVQCSLNGGEVSLMPMYDPSSAQLHLGSGSRISRVSLSPELCHEWLGYVAPMLADTAQVEGEISARVERFLWDFNSASHSDVTAQMIIHRGQAAPGASLASLLEVVDLLRRTGDSPAYSERSLVLPEQTVTVQVRQGVVHHDSLMMELSGYRLRSSGAVGLNQQLQLTLDVPLEKTTATSAGRSLRIPLGGTIKSPQPDTTGLLQNLGTQKIQEKVGDQVDKALNKQLNKLFDKF